MIKFIALTLVVLSATGCTRMMNIGSPDYACKGMPDGASCMSAKQVFDATEGENYRTQIEKEKDAAQGKDTAATATSQQPQTRVLYAEGSDNAPIPMRARNPLPIRTQAVVMRIAIDPWEDESGDLHVPGFIYTEIEPRRWEIGARNQDQSPTLTPLSTK